MNVRRAGESALLVEVADLGSVLALSAAFRDEAIEGVLEVVPAARTVLLLCDPDASSLDAVADSVRRIRPSDHRPWLEEVVEIPVSYDGPDTEDVVSLTGMSRQQLIDWHTGATWHVAFSGFAPGFGYLVTDDARSIPRKDTPRTTVPAGSVGLAGEFSGVYPRASPGGWQLIGRTAVTLLDVAADPPTLLRPGIEVRFVDQT